MAVPFDQTAEKEKRRVALSSVVAAVFLTALKAVVGILTNSLGILSEAAHSGLDLIAAGVTYFAVRVSDRPPDRDHPYGHGKVENLSALIETLLLLGTCVWIVSEAIKRLREPVQIEANIWSFVVMGISIVVDLSRSRALMAMAKKHNSQALEADALHFSTDVWSSAVVILGLVAVRVAQWLKTSSEVQAEWLFHADAIAALGVSAIVVYVSIKLGRRTVSVLLDSTDQATSDLIEQTVSRIPGVSRVHQVRARHSGPSTFVDMTLDIPRSASLEEAHQTASTVEDQVAQLFPRTDVIVRISPVVKDKLSMVEEVRSAAAKMGIGVHGIRAHDIRGTLSIEMHIEVPEELTLGQAHERVSDFEASLHDALPELRAIVTHIEPVGDSDARRPAFQTDSELVRQAVLQLPNNIVGVQHCHNIKIHSDGMDLSLSFHCRIDPSLPIGQAHRLTVEMESRLREQFPALGRVVIHPEPLTHKDEGPKP